MNVNLKLLPLKSHYFLFNAGTATFVPFIPTLIKQLGFSSAIVGTVYTILPITSFLGKPVAGAIADKFRCQKSMFIFFIFLTLLSYFIVPWVPAIESVSKSELHCSGPSFVRICPSIDFNSKHFLNNFRSDNRTTLCKMTCSANETMIKSVCESWKFPQYCGLHKPSPGDTISALALNHLNISSTPRTPSELKFVASLPQTLVFNAELFPSHTLLENKCFFIRMGRVEFNPPDWHVAYCEKLAVAPCSVDCNNTLINHITKEPIENKEAVHLYQFWLLLVCFIFGWVSMAVVTSVGDTICFELLGNEPSKYGLQRMWGSIGWGLFSLLAGYLVDLFSDNSIEKDYSPAIYLLLIMLGLDALVSSRLKYTQSKRSQHILKDIGAVMADVRIVVFMLWCFIVGVYTAFIWNFLFWYLEDLVNLPENSDSHQWIKTLEGIIMAIQCFCGELPFFFLSGWILKKLGHVRTMTLVLFAMGVRFTLYSFLINPWWCLPIEFLNGLTFGLFYATMTTYASVVAPPGTETTVQGLVGAVFEGFGVSMGSLMGGVMFSYLKGATVFRILGLIGLSISVVHFIVQFFIDIRSIPSRDNKAARYTNPNDALHILEDHSS